MSNDNLDTLIGGLTEELEECKPLAHPFKRILPWIVASVIYAVGVVAFLGVRPDLVHKANDVEFIFEVGLAAFITITAAMVSAWRTIPDMRQQGWISALPLTATAIFLFWSAVRFITEEGAAMPEMHWDHCFQDGAMVAFLPATALVFMMRKGASTCYASCCAMNMLAVSGLAYIALRFTCVMDTVGHSGIMHIMPFIVLGALMGLISRKVYSW